MAKRKAAELEQFEEGGGKRWKASEDEVGKGVDIVRRFMGEFFAAGLEESTEGLLARFAPDLEENAFVKEVLEG